MQPLQLLFGSEGNLGIDHAGADRKSSEAAEVQRYGSRDVPQTSPTGVAFL